MRFLEGMSSLVVLVVVCILGFSFWTNGPEKTGWQVGVFLHNVTKGFKGEAFGQGS
jgi:hypothetical protein